MKDPDFSIYPLFSQISADNFLDFGPERGPGKGTMADLGPLIRHLVSTRLPSGGRAAFFVSFVPLGRH